MITLIIIFSTYTGLYIIIYINFGYINCIQYKGNFYINKLKFNQNLEKEGEKLLKLLWLFIII